MKILSKINPLYGLDFLLQVKSEDRNCFQIILWWEIRRILYNIIVGFIGFFCWMALWELVPCDPGTDVIEPILIAAFGYLCNICYTLGWITEISLIAIVKIKGDSQQWIMPGKTYAPMCFKLGLCFTLFWIFLPVALWCVIDFCDYLGTIHLADY